MTTTTHVDKTTATPEQLLRIAVHELLPSVEHIESVEVTRDTIEGVPRNGWRSYVTGPWATVSVRVRLTTPEEEAKP